MTYLYVALGSLVVGVVLGAIGWARYQAKAAAVVAAVEKK